MTHLKPEEAFPEEIVELHKQGIPWPTFLAAPLVKRIYSVDEIAEVLEQARQKAEAPLLQLDKSEAVDPNLL